MNEFISKIGSFCIKRIAELIVQNHSNKSKSTCFSMVRFGNVLGSSGSATVSLSNSGTNDLTYTTSSDNAKFTVSPASGSVAWLDSDDITVRNIVAAAATFSGSVTIGGTLTYEDVKNVDSIGVITARSGIQGIGIQSGGINITTGILTAINFTGIGNTVTYDASTKIVSVSVGGVGAGGTFASNTVGVHTTKILGINTTTIAGSATSEGAVQVRGNIAIEEGLLTLDSNINTSVSVPSGKNALLIGPTTVGTGATIDIATGSTLVVV